MLFFDHHSLQRLLEFSRWLNGFFVQCKHGFTEALFFRLQQLFAKILIDPRQTAKHQEPLLVFLLQAVHFDSEARFLDSRLAMDLLLGFPP